MLDLLTLGSISIDLYYKGKSLTEVDGRIELAMGGKYYVDHFYEGLGGGGANVAIGVARAGLKSGLMSKIGDNPFKEIILSKLKAKSIEFKEFCDIKDDYINISSVLLNSKGEKTIVNYRTGHEQILNHDDDCQKLDKAKAVYMANLSKATITERMKILKYAKDKEKMVFANLNVTDCRRPLEDIMHFISVIDGLIINGHEYADIIKTPYESIDFDSNVVEKYAPFSPEKILVITDGRRGSYCYFENKVYRQKAVRVDNILDTTGAGDAYTAGFIAEYLKSKDIQKAMEEGAKYAVDILGKIGAN